MRKPLIIGIATVDAVARTVERFPAPGGLVLFDQLTIATGGCAVNTALALARLGVGADVVTRVGRDPNGDFVVAELERHGVPGAGVVRDAERGTSYSFAAVLESGERSFLHTTGANARIGPGDAPDASLDSRPLVFVAGVMVMDSLDGEPAAEVLRRARARGAVTMLDTVFVEGTPREEWLRRVGPSLPHLDYFVPSLPEAVAISGREDALAAARLFRDRGVRRVAVKLGDRGALCLDEDGRDELVGPFGVARVVDATGAGDCWCAGFIAGLLGGQEFVQAARLGNAVAAVGITGAGATNAVPPLADVLAFMQSHETA